MRQFMAQWKKDGLIIDERWNSGGQIPDRFIELLNRPIVAYWAVRDGASQQWPPVAHRGPQVMLINGWSGSGGDAFPFYFRAGGLGPLIGTRTWGGLIGISGAPAARRRRQRHRADLPDVRPEGQWFAEGHGVEPDIEVDEDPIAARQGHRSAARARDQGSVGPRRQVAGAADPAGLRTTSSAKNREWRGELGLPPSPRLRRAGRVPRLRQGYGAASRDSSPPSPREDGQLISSCSS